MTQIEPTPRNSPNDPTPPLVEGAGRISELEAQLQQFVGGEAIKVWHWDSGTGEQLDEPFRQVQPIDRVFMNLDQDGIILSWKKSESKRKYICLFPKHMEITPIERGLKFTDIDSGDWVELRLPSSATK